MKPVIALVGRPNVGKSTLLNRLVGQKLSITAHKPQTTRHAVLGVNTRDNSQFIYIDTPGIHTGGKRTLNRVLNKTAASAATGADVLLLVVQAMVWTDDDQLAFDIISKQECPWILVVNKVDRVTPKERLLAWLPTLKATEGAAAVVPLSATKGHNLKALETEIEKLLPEADFVYGEEMFTDRSSRFLASELVREQLTRFLSQELPYSVSVEIEQFEDNGSMLSISALIWVEKQSQKSIVIGKGGAGLKEIGSRARIEMQRMFDRKVHLKLWVKVKDGWSDDASMIRSLGYETE